MILKYKHLNQETNAIMEKDSNSLQFWMRIPHFVFFDKTNNILEKTNWITQQTAIMQSLDDDELYDIESMSIVGETGAGKTTFCRFFKELYPKKNTGKKEIIPVVHIKLKSSIAGLTGFYSALLEPYGNPYANPEILRNQHVKIAHLHETLKVLIQKAETKLIFIDEFQHIFEMRKNGAVVNQAIINHLKLLMEEARVAIIPVGVLSTEAFLSIDSQLAGRCPIKEYSRLDYWEFPCDTQKNREARTRFRNLLKGFEAFLPFPEPSFLYSQVWAKQNLPRLLQSLFLIK